jgi:F-type H+-transporting ATPase subunit epsilon
MAENIRLEIVTPDKSVVSEDAQIVVGPGTLGEFGILRGHTPFLTTLNMGSVYYKDANGAERQIFISGGFAEALPDKVTILAESAERRRDIDIDRARSALTRAQKRLEEAQKEKLDFVRAKAALDRALYRIKVASSKGQ